MIANRLNIPVNPVSLEETNELNHIKKSKKTFSCCCVQQDLPKN